MGNRAEYALRARRTVLQQRAERRSHVLRLGARLVFRTGDGRWVVTDSPDDPARYTHCPDVFRALRRALRPA